MQNNTFVKLDNRVVAISEITNIDISDIEYSTVYVTTSDGATDTVTGFFAIELVWMLKPDALEGISCIKWVKHAWSIHNLIAHPLMQLLAYCRWYKTALWVHDITVPKPIDPTMRSATIDDLRKIQDDLHLTISQLALLFDVGLKRVCDWYDVYVVLDKDTQLKIRVLLDVLDNLPVEFNITKIKTIWYMNTLDGSFISIINKKHKNIVTFKDALNKKLTAMGHYINTHDNIDRNIYRVNLGSAHLAEFDRSTDS